MKSLSLLALLGSLAACNTFEGLGRDLAAGGEAITTAAEDAQQPQPSVYQQARPPAQPPVAYQRQTYQRPPAPAYDPAAQQPAAPVYAPAPVQQTPIQQQPLPALPAPQGQPTSGPYGF